MQTDNYDVNTQESFIDDMIKHLQYMKAHLRSEYLKGNTTSILHQRLYHKRYEEEILEYVESKE